MADIYASAGIIVTWLGLEADESELSEEPGSLLPPMTTVNHMVGFSVPREIELNTGAKADGREWTAVNKFLNCQWFGRLWVIQEIALSSCPVLFISGDGALPWNDLVTNIENLSLLDIVSIVEKRSPGERMLDLTATTPAALTLMEIIGHLREKITKMELSLGCLVQLNKLTQLCQATVPNCGINSPKPYGLANVKKPEVAPNYKKIGEGIYIEVTCHLMREELSLWVLCNAGISWKGRIPSLPLWVPDLNAEKSTNFRLGPPAQNGCLAGSDCSPVFDWDESTDDLTVGGILVDTVNRLSSCHPHLSQRLPMFLPTYPRKLLDLLKSSRLLIRDSNVKDCFWRTLMFNKNSKKEIAAAEEYGNWVDLLDIYFTLHGDGTINVFSRNEADFAAAELARDYFSQVQYLSF